MLKVNFTGVINEVEQGLSLVEENFGFVRDSNGLIVEVVKSLNDKETKISFDGVKGEIHFTTPSSFYRLLNLWLFNQKLGKPFELIEQPQFDKTGVMVDCSRNAVLSVSGRFEKKY